MMVVLPSYFLLPFLVPVRWFQANPKDCPNPAKPKFKVIVVVTRAYLGKDLETRVLGAMDVYQVVRGSL